MRLSKKYMIRKIKDQYFLLPVGQGLFENNHVYRLDEFGYSILEAFIEENTLENAILQLKEKYCLEDDDMPSFENAISSFVNSMQTRAYLIEGSKSLTNF